MIRRKVKTVSLKFLQGLLRPAGARAQVHIQSTAGALIHAVKKRRQPASTVAMLTSNTSNMCFNVKGKTRIPCPPVCVCVCVCVPVGEGQCRCDKGLSMSSCMALCRRATAWEGIVIIYYNISVML